MSTRNLLNLTTGAVATLLVAAIAIAFTTVGNRDRSVAQVELTKRQQMLVQDLTRQVSDLTAAASLQDVQEVRSDLGHTIVQFDQALTALLHGGEIRLEDGRVLTVPRTGDGRARTALEEGARLWIDTGVPLSDLAAGEYSIFSAAGRQAVRGLQDNHVALMGTMAEAAGHLRQADATRSSIGTYARWAAAGLALALVALGFRRRRTILLSAIEPSATADSVGGEPAVTDVTAEPSSRVAPTAPATLYGQDRSYSSPVDFDSVNAAVDQMSVDMNTIAGSTDKMRLAIDSVGFALQGMLFSLREMAQDTAEGHKIVKGANNAATFTADTAEELAASAREMSRVVTRVTQLALHTRQVAGQIEGEAVHTGKTGEAFTSVVANEVKDLAGQTNRATAEIDQTVSSILVTAREYEEAIGQIIKNIAAINKVSQNLGKLMLDPPRRVEPSPQAPTALPLDPAADTPPQAVPAPLPAAEAPDVPDFDPVDPQMEDVVEAAPPEMPTRPEAAPETATAEPLDDLLDIDPTLDEVADTTSTAIADAAEITEDETAPEAEAAGPEPEAAEPEVEAAPETLGLADKTDADTPVAGAGIESASAIDDHLVGIPAAEAPPAADPVAPAESESVTQAPADDDMPKADGGSNANVFMLNKPRVSAEPAPTVPAAEDDGEESTESNAYNLNTPANTNPADDAATDPQADVSGPDDKPAQDEMDTGRTVFMLNKPK